MALNLGVAVSIVGEVDSSGSGVAQVIDVARRLRLRNTAQAAPADKAYTARLVLDPGGHQDLDLSAELLDAVGVRSTFTEVRVIFVAAAVANAHAVRVGGAGASAFVAPFGGGDDALTLPAGGLAVLTAPGAGQWPVDAGAATLRLANAGGVAAVTCDLVVVGSTVGGGESPGGGSDPAGTIGFNFNDPNDLWQAV